MLYSALFLRFPKIMFGVLIVVLCLDGVPGGLGLAREGEIPFDALRRLRAVLRPTAILSRPFVTSSDL
jgi:hypothetical protein